MDDVARFNKERWEALAKAGVMYSRPALDLTVEAARQMVDREGKMDHPRGRDVLCLASGGGQQSAAFGLLGARVTVLDLCETQLERDRQAADHYGLSVRTVQGDMRDLSCFEPGSFDLVFHAHSLNFVPDAGLVFDQVRRVLRPRGQYRLHCWNPMAHALDPASWNGKGYLLAIPYVEGAEVSLDPYWDFEPWDATGKPSKSGDADSEPAAAPNAPPPAPARLRMRGPREFRHTVTTLVNGLIDRGFVIQKLWEEDLGDPSAEPGSWQHFKSYAPPWLGIWARLVGQEELQ